MKAAYTVLVVLSLFCFGCATPPEVKQALIAKDQAYVENERLMQQYRELIGNVTQRHQSWYRYVQTRLKLNVALQWATTNPQLIDVADAELAKDEAELLGTDIIALINEIRLKNLPERIGPSGQIVFQAGTGNMNNLLQKLPELIGRIEERVADDSRTSSKVDLTVFDQYRTNVEVIRRINAIVKQYLDIDVTLSGNDVQTLAEGVQALRR